MFLRSFVRSCVLHETNDYILQNRKQTAVFVSAFVRKFALLGKGKLPHKCMLTRYVRQPIFIKIFNALYLHLKVKFLNRLAVPAKMAVSHVLCVAGSCTHRQDVKGVRLSYPILVSSVSVERRHYVKGVIALPGQCVRPSFRSTIECMSNITGSNVCLTLQRVMSVLYYRE